ncbi:MAG TPA: ferredoxin [Novosphingobium sp.]|mgnify:CR=1 FL=1|nr:ferredoxin [Novosphingobium sp.]HMP56759.1 ferredoxin [Novosphingobium sp.]
MFVCICNAIRECELREAARTCCSSGSEAIYAALGHQPQCGQCLDEAEALIADERARSQPRMLAVA